MIQPLLYITYDYMLILIANDLIAITDVLHSGIVQVIYGIIDKDHLDHERGGLALSIN